MALIWDDNKQLHLLRDGAKALDIDMADFFIMSDTAETEIEDSIKNILIAKDIDKHFAIHFHSKQPLSYVICVYPHKQILPEEWWLDITQKEELINGKSYNRIF